jgi:acetyl esterase/lipase
MQTFTLDLAHPGVTLTAYLLDASPEMADRQIRPAVLVLPGGGYRGCSDREAEPIALAFLAGGMHAFVLRYSLNDQAKFPRPLEDAVEALELIRSRCEEWKVDPQRVAACGFSAGGHLAAALATLGASRPNALVLAYPCILEEMSAILPWPIPSLEREVDAQTPPAFIFATAEDELVPVRNSLEFTAALNRLKIPFELHIFQHGVHGLALANALTANGQEKFVDSRAAEWIRLCLGWLERVFQGDAHARGL